MSRNHSAYEQRIINRLWKLSLDLCGNIRENGTSFVTIANSRTSLKKTDGAYLQVAVAITLGILRALRKSVTGLDARSIEYLDSLGAKLLDKDVLTKIHKAASLIDCEAGSMPSYPERHHDSIFVGIQMFRLLETFLVYGLVKSKDHVDNKIEPWDWVVNTAHTLQPLQDSETKSFISTMFKYLWGTAWPLDDSASDGVYYLQSMTMVWSISPSHCLFCNI